MHYKEQALSLVADFICVFLELNGLVNNEGMSSLWTLTLLFLDKPTGGSLPVLCTHYFTTDNFLYLN